MSGTWTSGASSKEATSRLGRPDAFSVGDTANQQERDVEKPLYTPQHQKACLTTSTCKGEVSDDPWITTA